MRRNVFDIMLHHRERKRMMRTDILESFKRYSKEELLQMNQSEIARRFNCNRRTVKKYMESAVNESTKTTKRKKRSSVLDSYEEVILDKIDNHGATAMATYLFVKKKGYQGKYSTLAQFVKKHKDQERKKATIRFETSPGLQAQVDWKEDLTLYNRNGEKFRVNIFLMVLGYSRLKFIKLTSDRTQNTLFSCLIDGFSYYHGIPQEILFDNMKTVVDQSKSTFSHTIFNESFRYFSTDACFRPIACRPYRPQTKGKVESLARLVDRLVVYNYEFDTYDDLESIVNEFLEELNNEVSQATNEVPFERFKKEKEYLNPLPSLDALLSYITPTKKYKVSKESMIRYKGKKYSVPIKYIGERLVVTETPDDKLCIYYNDDFIVCHPMSDKNFNYKYGHMHEILKSDACKHLSDDEIDDFIHDNIVDMDRFLGV